MPYYPYQPGYGQAGIYHELQYSEDCVLGKYICQIFEVDRPHDCEICILPDGCNDILVHYDGKQVQSWLSPSIVKAMQFHFEQTEWLFGVRFYPGATSSFLPTDFSYQSPTPIALENLYPSIRYIKPALESSQSFARRHEIMYEFLKQTVLEQTPTDNIVDFCVKKNIENNGMIAIDELAQAAGYGPRYIRQLFATYVGHSTKELAKIIRLQKTLQYIEQHPEEKLKDISAQFGFSDHSHMNKELRQFLGITSGIIKDTTDWNALLKTEFKRTF